MKSKILMLIVIFSFIVFATPTLLSQPKGSQAGGNLTVGIVDIEAIVKEMPEAIDADKKLSDIGQKYKDSLAKMETNLKTKLEAYQKQKAMMSVDKQQQEEEKLQKENTVLTTFYNEKFGQNGELAQTRESLLQPIRDKIKATIEIVAKDEKINLVLTKEAGTVMYADSKLDITFRVIDKMKRDK